MSFQDFMQEHVRLHGQENAASYLKQKVGTLSAKEIGLIPMILTISTPVLGKEQKRCAHKDALK